MPPGPESVSSGQQDHARGSGRQPVHDEAVPGEHPFQADPPVAQLVVQSRIAAGQVEHEARPHLLQHRRQVPAQGVQVRLVVHVRAQGQAGRGHRPAVAQVAVVDRKGMDRGILGEEGAGPVAVVQVQIHHEDGRAEAPIAQRGYGDGHVVEHAEAGSGGRGRMVESPSQVDGDPAVPVGPAGREKGPSAHQTLKAEELVLTGRIQGEAQHGFQGAGILQRPQIPVVMHRLEATQRDGPGPAEHSPSQEVALLQVGEDPEGPAGVVLGKGEVQQVALMNDEARAAGPANGLEQLIQGLPHGLILQRSGADPVGQLRRPAGDAGKIFPGPPNH